jgi:desulfoferrodoxin (superoxide reductase-like protein)
VGKRGGSQLSLDEGGVSKRRLNMKRLTLLTMAIVIVLLAGTVLAHPPKDVRVEFDPDSKILMVTAYHDTKDATKHYVGLIEVELNGEKIIEQKFKAQIASDVQKAQYWINDAKLGDELAVTATCNIAGKKKVTMKVEKKAEPEPVEPEAHGDK